MVLTLFIYAMAHGVSSSRQMERLCGTDVAFRVICAQDVPDHTVLARFRKNHQQALTDLLAESLALAAELGMVCLGTVALDGTKIAGNASRDANHREAHLRKLAEGYLDTLAETDRVEDEVFGEDNRGDELPPEVRDRSGRRERIDQALEQIKTRRAQAAKASKEQDQRVQACEQAVVEGTKGRGRYPRAPTGSRWPESGGSANTTRPRPATSSGKTPGNGANPAGAGPAAPPDEQHRIRRAWAAYQAETDAAAAASKPTGDPSAETAEAPVTRNPRPLEIPVLVSGSPRT